MYSVYRVLVVATVAAKGAATVAWYMWAATTTRAAVAAAAEEKLQRRYWRSIARPRRRDALIPYQIMVWNNTLASVSIRVNIGLKWQLGIQ
jgi:hypothetical protein